MVAEMTLRTLVSLKSNKDMRRVIPADLWSSQSLELLD
jgi:hypothetical protein